VEANARAESEAVHEQHAALLALMQSQLAEQRDRERQAMEEEMAARSKTLASQVRPPPLSLQVPTRLPVGAYAPSPPSPRDLACISQMAQLKQIHAHEMADMKASLAGTIEDYETSMRQTADAARNEVVQAARESEAHTRALQVLLPPSLPFRPLLVRHSHRSL
tara:strand:+ start:27 stop:518 length:492 start_codon:yes stop_codon:yes gene_type:complete